MNSHNGYVRDSCNKKAPGRSRPRGDGEAGYRRCSGRRPRDRGDPPGPPPVLGRGNYAEGIDQVEDGATDTEQQRPGVRHHLPHTRRGKHPNTHRGQRTRKNTIGRAADKGTDRAKRPVPPRSKRSLTGNQETLKSGKRLSSTSSTKTFPFSVATATPSNTRSEGPDQAKTKTPNPPGDGGEKRGQCSELG